MDLNILEPALIIFLLVIAILKNIETKINSLKKLKAAGFKINVYKSFSARDILEYLGFKITRQALMTLSDKVHVIKDTVVRTKK